MKRDKTRILIIVLAIVVLAGLGLLISRQIFNYGGLAFDVLTYILSIAALVLAIVSVMNSVRQNRVMRLMVHDVHAAVLELQSVTKSNVKIEREIRDEYRMNKVITDVLSEYGIGDDEKVRRKIAKRVSHRLKKPRA